MLKIEGLSKRYRQSGKAGGHVQALDNVSLSVCQGETLGIVGASGCGKTTLARVLMRLERPDQGSVSWQGEDLLSIPMRKYRPMRKKIQMIYQDPTGSLNPSQTIRKTMLEPMEIHKMYDKISREEKIVQVFEKLKLPLSLMDRYPHQISGGEAQRIVIARALTLEPQVLILDEPTSMLDVSIQAKIMQLLRSIQEELGLTYLFISHDLEVVSWIGSKIAFMEDGRITEQGETKSLLEHPQTEGAKRMVDLFFRW